MQNVKFKPNPKAKAPYGVAFSATGKGFVLCERWRNDTGAAADSIKYLNPEMGPMKSALTPRERREYEAAAAQEWGA